MRKSENGIYGYFDVYTKSMVYIGQSGYIKYRHLQHLNGTKIAIDRRLKLYPDRYQLIYIKTRDSFTKKEKDVLEKHYITFYNTFSDPQKFNKTIGGNGSIYEDIIYDLGGIDSIKILAKNGYTAQQIADYFTIPKNYLRKFLRKNDTSILILRYS